jgi:hypothetical protein
VGAQVIENRSICDVERFFLLFDLKIEKKGTNHSIILPEFWVSEQESIANLVAVSNKSSYLLGWFFGHKDRLMMAR